VEKLPADSPKIKTNVESLANAASVSSSRASRWVEVMDRTHDGRQPQCIMAKVNDALVALAVELMPTEQERLSWQRAFQMTRAALLSRWPGGRVVLFGSAANGLSVRSSNDIDVCLELDAVGIDDTEKKAEVVEAAAEALQDAGMKEILALPKARVPVVKCTCPSTGTKIDLTVNNTLACINTKMIADYCQIDPRLAQLVAVVKHWAKQRAVNDPYTGTLSSYCYVLMCIHHLQTRNPPVLPVLQALPPTFAARVGEWSAAFFDDAQSLSGFGTENKQTLADLAWEFFEYWAWRHNYVNGVISVRTGGIVTKEEKGWTRRVGNERHLMCVEDPFVLTHDLGRTVDIQTREVLRKEFWRAATIFRDYDDPLPELMKPYRPRRR
jgi:DNA polymerase sigma